MKKLVKYIFGRAASEDDEIVNMYKDLNKYAMRKYARKYHKKKMKKIKVFNDDELVDLVGCTRVEVIGDTGRQFHNWSANNKVKLSIQDDGRTIKIFITTKDKIF